MLNMSRWMNVMRLWCLLEYHCSMPPPFPRLVHSTIISKNSIIVTKYSLIIRLYSWPSLPGFTRSILIPDTIVKCSHANVFWVLSCAQYCLLPFQAFLTAFQLLHLVAHIQAGETVLVHAGKLKTCFENQCYYGQNSILSMSTDVTTICSKFYGGRRACTDFGLLCRPRARSVKRLIDFIIIFGIRSAFCIFIFLK